MIERKKLMEKSVDKKKEFFIVKCMNKECNNYKMELNEGTEICSLCNTPVTQVEIKTNRPLAKKAMLFAVIGFIAAMGGGWFIGMVLMIWQLGFALSIGGLLAMIVGLVLGIRSKGTSAIVVSSVGAAIVIAQEIYFFMM